ncbi:MAG TPA: pyridoxamine 5'-phosphate oxidase family protein [Acidimicrobiales bacterium]|nr:pyridoxamine 5'-phosphate oxidase family protein [Acidimicrobiales bacterium]
MESTPRGRRLVAIAEEECWQLVSTRRWGRLLVVVANHPELFPVDHLVDGRSLLVRTEEGTKLRAALGARVGFEVDEVDDDARLGWTVMLAGYANEVFDTRELELAEVDADEAVWTGDRVHWLRIVPFKVSGRRLVALAS